MVTLNAMVMDIVKGIKNVVKITVADIYVLKQVRDRYQIIWRWFLSIEAANERCSLFFTYDLNIRPLIYRTTALDIFENIFEIYWKKRD